MKIKRTNIEKKYEKELAKYFYKSVVSTTEKLENFVKYTSRQALARFLFRERLFRKILDIHGSIVECGVYQGNGLMTWAKLSSIYEPYNYQRKIIGFDTFEGFPKIAEQDLEAIDKLPEVKIGGMKVKNIYSDLKKCIQLYDMNRPLNHIEKVELVKGDANTTFPKYLKTNPHLVISLLYLDFDLYKPTKTVLELAISRISKGGIIAFDQLNNVQWPGETQAVLEVLGIKNLRLQRFSFEPCRSYAVIE